MAQDPVEYLRQRFEAELFANFPTEFGAALPPVQVENIKFDRVDVDYLSIYLIVNSTKRASIGTGKKFIRNAGFLCIEVQVVEDSGTRNMWRMSDAVARSLQESQWTLDDGSVVTTYTAKPIGNTSQDGRYFVTVMIPFQLDACYS
jgi:hypothetical protein